MSKKDQLTQKIEKALADSEWSRYYFHLKEEETDHLLEAAVDKDTWDIEVKVDPKLRKKLPSIVREYCKAVKQYFTSLFEKIPDEQLIEDIILSSANHEIGHWEICPFDRDYYADILAGTQAGLKDGGLKPEDTEDLQYRVSNMFMDVIDNVVNCIQSKDPAKYKQGIGLFYLKEGMLALIQNPTQGFSAAYALFASTQMKMCADNEEFLYLAERFYQGTDLAQLTAKALDIFLDGKIKITSLKDIQKYKTRIAEELQKHIERDKKGKVIDVVWRRKAYEFAKLIAPLMKDMQEYVPESAYSQKAKQDKGFRRDVTKRQLKRKGLGKPKGKKPGKSDKYSPGSGYSKARIPTPQEVREYDQLYKQRADKILLEYIRGNRDDKKFVVDFLAKSRINEDDSIDLETIDWPSTMPIKRKDKVSTGVWLFRSELPLEIITPGTVTAGGLPDLCFIVDTSGSMDWSPEAGKGKYDLLLRAVYSVFNYLEYTRRAYSINYAVINFSDATRFSGWYDYYNLNKIKRELFTHQDGGTTLDPLKVQQMMDQAKDRFAVIMVSDGAISGAETLVQHFTHLIANGNDYSLIQIGGHSQFSKLMKANGAEVHVLRSASKIPGITLGKARQVYNPVGLVLNT
jgi:hypothetical protein